MNNFEEEQSNYMQFSNITDTEENFNSNSSDKKSYIKRKKHRTNSFSSSKSFTSEVFMSIFNNEYTAFDDLDNDNEKVLKSFSLNTPKDLPKKQSEDIPSLKEENSEENSIKKFIQGYSKFDKNNLSDGLKLQAQLLRILKHINDNEYRKGSKLSTKTSLNNSKNEQFNDANKQIQKKK